MDEFNNLNEIDDSGQPEPSQLPADKPTHSHQIQFETPNRNHEMPAKLQERPNYVLPPKKYKLKTLLMFTDFILIVIYIYLELISGTINDMLNKRFSFISNQMFAFYCVLAITIAMLIFILIFKKTKSARTRFERDNELREDENIKVWLTGYDWGWPILFLPTMLLMLAGGILGLILNFIAKDAACVIVIQHFIGGTILVFGAFNAAVVIFKLKPVTLGLILGSFCVVLLILLLHGLGSFVSFFKSFRHLGVANDPLGYILLAYIWSIFLRIIWVRSLFHYWVFLPNRLELQHGLSESNDSVDRDDLRHQIDTDDVILRWFNVGIVTFYFPRLDRLPITNIMPGIRKKALYANRIASIKTMQD